MEYLNLKRAKAVETMNTLGEGRIPFVFYTDYLGSSTSIFPLSNANSIYYDFNAIRNTSKTLNIPRLELEVFPPAIEDYQQAFESAIYHLIRGDSYLLNLTFPSRVLSNLNLNEIFHLAKAPYKLHVPGRFTVFSPETFIRIENSIISTYPMKGTIKVNSPNAEQQLIGNRKELAEHSTIVDLMRNDLSMVSQNVTVESFRYSDRIKTQSGDLIQTSSRIVGKIESNYHSHLGSILYKLLPAGSISGAPKAKTIEIINNIESDARGNYTGICGIYDGNSLDSGVMIRYIEELDNKLYFRSGGGITAKSNLHKEYQELIDKINVPTNRNYTYQAGANTQSIVS